MNGAGAFLFFGCISLLDVIYADRAENEGLCTKD